MFIAYVNQTDNGCDYTIACGKVLWELEANTQEEALQELMREILGTFHAKDGSWEEGWYGEHELDSVVLYEVSGALSAPLSEWYAQAKQMTAIAKQRNKEETERKHYEELKKKFGDS